MALVIAAGIFMGDLITVLASLLRGEITSRFLAKSFVVLLLSGGVFYYYFGGLRKNEATSARFDRDRFMAALSSVAVVFLIILGFVQLGAPRAQREIRADNQRIHQLYQLSNEIRNYWNTHSLQLPASTDQVLGATYHDPVTNAPYEYHQGQGSRYQLCATFMRASARHDSALGPDHWVHPTGHYCFQLDASVEMPFPQQYYP